MKHKNHKMPSEKKMDKMHKEMTKKPPKRAK